MCDQWTFRTHSWLRTGAGILLFISFLSIAMQAQVANTGSVQGTVSDITGALIPGANRYPSQHS